MAMLTQSEVAAYQDQGYLPLRQRIDVRELAPVRALITELVDERAREYYREGKISSLYEDESFERRLVRINEESEIKAGNWDLARLVDYPELFGLVRNPAILDPLESLLGPEIAWTGSYVTRPKLPQDKHTAFAWHQDSQSYGEPTKHLHVVSVWIPLVDVDEHNGYLHVIPGSHTWGLLSSERDEINQIRTFDDVEKRGKPVALPMKKGDVLFFSNLLFHMSKLNTTNTVRWSVDLRYVEPPDSRVLTEYERQGYETFDSKYRMRPVTVRSRQPDKIAGLAQLRESVVERSYRLQEAKRRQNQTLSSAPAGADESPLSSPEKREK